MNKTFLASYHEFMYLSEEQQGDKGMGQLMGKLHEPVQVVPDSKDFQ